MVSINFEKHAHHANEIINEVANALGIPENREKAGRVLTSVLHALRNRITIQESLHMMSQLPLFIKGIYVEGWKLREARTDVDNIDEFVKDVEKEAGFTKNEDFPSREESLRAISTVFNVLKHHISEGQEKHIEDVLPKHLKELWREPVAH